MSDFFLHRRNSRWSAALLLTLAMPVAALTGVNPTGVNINRHDVTTVFLTFQGTAGERAGDAFWCLRLNTAPNIVTNSNPCVPGTIIGHLPARLDLSRPSGPGAPAGPANTTDIMTIPASVARRAVQAAQSGGPSQFFYVREFIADNGLRSYISVTCRQAGGGARMPLALTYVEPQFDVATPQAVTVLAPGDEPPPVRAHLRYNGSGRLRGRWEVVLPGDPPPEPFDLLSEASLPIEQRGRQQRYSVLSRFDVFLPPTGEAILAGPPPERIPVQARGGYFLLLRIEASADKEGDSNTEFGIVQSGGLAGFPMPVLRYYVGAPQAVFADALREAIEPLNPASAKPVAGDQPLDLRWRPIAGAELLLLEIGAAGASAIFSALLPSDHVRYRVPQHVREQVGAALSWRLHGLDAAGRSLGSSPAQTVLLAPAIPDARRPDM